MGTRVAKQRSAASSLAGKVLMSQKSDFQPPQTSPDAPIEYSMFWQLWREERFFECHEVLEELWKRTKTRERWFYNGLIHCAVSIYQHRRGNAIGACRQLVRAQVKLRAFAPRFGGVEIALLLSFVENEIASSLSQTSDVQRASWPALRTHIEERMARDFLQNGALDKLGES